MGFLFLVVFTGVGGKGYSQLLDGLALCVCVSCRHLQQACWARPYHGAGFGEALVGPGRSQRGQTGMAAPLGFRCPGSSYWVLLAQLKDWNRCNSGNRTGSWWGQHWLSSVLFSSRETGSRDSVNGRIESTERLQSVKFRDALLGKWKLGDCRVSLLSSPPSLGSFLTNLKSSRTQAGFLQISVEVKMKSHQRNGGWVSGVSSPALWGVVTREHGKTLWKHRRLSEDWIKDMKEIIPQSLSICCKRNYFRASIY